MNKIVILILAFIVGFGAAMIAEFSHDKAIFMGQFIITLGIILYADVINDLAKIRSEVNKDEHYRKKDKG